MGLRGMANSDPPATKFADNDALSRTLSAQLGASLKAAIRARGLASLVVSGGKSPIKLFERLRAEDLDWSLVCVASLPTPAATKSWCAMCSCRDPRRRRASWG